MRKLIVCKIVSLDGCISGPGGDVMAMPFDGGFSDYNAERLRAADTLLLGRRSYEGFRSYWPAIAEDVSQPAVEREISRLNAAIDAFFGAPKWALALLREGGIRLALVATVAIGGSLGIAICCLSVSADRKSPSSGCIGSRAGWLAILLGTGGGPRRG